MVLCKNIISLISLSKGGINFLSKNFDLFKILRNFLIITTEETIKNPLISNILKEENFFCLKIQSSNENLFLNKSLYEYGKNSQINSMLINLNSNIELNTDLIIKIHLIQLRYLLELQFVVNKKIKFSFYQK